MQKRSICTYQKYDEESFFLNPEFIKYERKMMTNLCDPKIA
jgi:hypothetical protein